MLRGSQGVATADGTGRDEDGVSEAEVAVGPDADFLEAVKEMEFQMLDMDLGLGDLSFLSSGFRCDAFTAGNQPFVFLTNYKFKSCVR